MASDYAIGLATLKFLGLAITAVSATWALVSKTTYEDEQGRKRLTPSGYISILIIVGGTLVSATSFGFEGAQKASEAAKAASATIASAIERQRQEAEQRAQIENLSNQAAREAVKAASRDLQLAREINAGSQATLQRTEQLLLDTQRLKNPLENFSFEALITIPGSTTNLKADLKEISAFADHPPGHDPLFFSTEPIIWDEVNGRAENLFIRPEADIYPKSRWLQKFFLDPITLQFTAQQSPHDSADLVFTLYPIGLPALRFDRSTQSISYSFVADRIELISNSGRIPSRIELEQASLKISPFSGMHNDVEQTRNPYPWLRATMVMSSPNLGVAGRHYRPQIQRSQGISSAEFIAAQLPKSTPRH